MYFYFFANAQENNFTNAQLSEANHGHKKTIKNQSVNGTFGFSNAQSKRKKPKEPFFHYNHRIK